MSLAKTGLLFLGLDVLSCCVLSGLPYDCSKAMGHLKEFEPNWPPTNPSNDSKAIGVHINDVTMSRYGVSNHQLLVYFFNRLLRWTLKKTSKLRVTGLCEVNPLVTGGSPHKGPVTWKRFPFDDVIMVCIMRNSWYGNAVHFTGSLSGESTCQRRILLTMGLWYEALVFSMLLELPSCWTNKWVANDLRCRDTHESSQ